jgi:voltage-gated potassium channel
LGATFRYHRGASIFRAQKSHAESASQETSFIEYDSLSASHIAENPQDLRSLVYKEMNLPATIPGRLFFGFIIFCIFASTIVFIVQTEPKFSQDPTAGSVSSVWSVLEIVFTVIFGVEILLQVWAHPEPRSGIAKSAFFWIDILGCLPIISLAIGDGGAGLRAARVLRLLRLFRLLRLAKYSTGMGSSQLLFLIVGRAARATVLPISAVLFIMVVFSTLVYYTENLEYDEALGRKVIPDPVCIALPKYLDGTMPCVANPAKLISIPVALYWAATTASTAGYGDIIPQSGVARSFTVLFFFLAILLLCMPLSIASNTYSKIVSKMIAGQSAEQEFQAFKAEIFSANPLRAQQQHRPVLVQLHADLRHDVRQVFSHLVFELAAEQQEFLAHTPTALYMHVRVFLIGIRAILLKRLTNPMHRFSLHAPKSSMQPTSPFSARAVSMCIRHEKRTSMFISTMSASRQPSSVADPGVS